MIIKLFLIIEGTLLLILGRRLFWFFVAGVGFLVGLEYTQQVQVFQSEIVVWIFALVMGVIGALLALFFQKVAIALAGFIVGGIAADHLLEFFHLGTGSSIIWPVLFVSGILGAVVVLILFDWGLIILSSIAGAITLLKVFPKDSYPESLIFGVLTLCGILIQTFMMQKRRFTKK